MEKGARHNLMTVSPQIIEKLVQKIQLSPSDRPLLVAVSGGVDSMTLLHLAADYCRENNQELMVIHINHGLRTTALRDQQCVVRYCEARQIPCLIRAIQIEDIPPKLRRGMEADARELRYAEFVRVARELNAYAVLLGHHGEDQVETFLWRWLRGTGMRGLGGVREVVQKEGVYFLRPLLSFRKSELSDYAMEQKIPYCMDETNLDTQYTRNFLRHHILPQLYQFQPHLVENTNRLTNILQEEDEYLHCVSQNMVSKCVRQKNGEYFFDIPQWLCYPIPLQRRAIQIILYCFPSVDWTFAHVESILKLLSTSQPSATVQLPNGITARRNYHQLWIGKDKADSDVHVSVDWHLENGNDVSEISLLKWKFHCEKIDVATHGLQASSQFELRIPLVSRLSIQTISSSERVYLLGMTGSKKVQDIFTDRKVPRQLRAEWPGIYYREKLIWLPGLARSREQVLSKHDLGWKIQAYPNPDITELWIHRDTSSM